MENGEGPAGLIHHASNTRWTWGELHIFKLHYISLKASFFFFYHSREAVLVPPQAGSVFTADRGQQEARLVQMFRRGTPRSKQPRRSEEVREIYY